MKNTRLLESAPFLEGRTEPCGDCRGPYEFWGLAENYRLFRCIPCQVVRFVGKDAPERSPAERPWPGVSAERPAPEKTLLRKSAPLRIAS